MRARLREKVSNSRCNCRELAAGVIHRFREKPQSGADLGPPGDEREAVDERRPAVSNGVRGVDWSSRKSNRIYGLDRFETKAFARLLV
jgi:hypothetical protein